MDQAKHKDVIYGFFTVEVSNDSIIKRWNPAQVCGLTARQQFEHNQRVDPEFTILQIRDKQVA